MHCANLTCCEVRLPDPPPELPAAAELVEDELELPHAASAGQHSNTAAAGAILGTRRRFGDLV
jgi:hypothetical protein